MKVGMRKPSLKKSISARTTGRAKRSIKKNLNPMYGKKGMGMINSPKKSMYNKIYHKTTFGVKDVINAETTTHKNNIDTSTSSKTGFLDFIVALCNLIYSFVMAMFYLVITLGLLAIIVGIFYITFKLIF